MPKHYEGGCHCGAIRYTCTKDPEVTFYCHCYDCQRTTGSPFSIELMIDKQSFELAGSPESYVVPGDSGKPVTPDMHIYTAAKQPWLRIEDGLPQYEKAPDL